MKYYHAGPRGLREILPPSITNAVSSASYGAAHVCRRDRVYVTTSFDAAVGFASLCPTPGTIYEVDPRNPLRDPDCLSDGLSFEAESARIIREIRVPGKLLKKARKVWMAA